MIDSAKLNNIESQIDHCVKDPAWRPYWGWHNDYADCGPGYLPAIQQARGEFLSMLSEIAKNDLVGGRCLQLGLGPCSASHYVWCRIFKKVATIDLAKCLFNDTEWAGKDTRTEDARGWAVAVKGGHLYDFLFIDAGHDFDSVKSDYLNYSDMVRSGGIIAFHDALERDGYPEVKVHEFIKLLSKDIKITGTEIGTAIMVKE